MHDVYIVDKNTAVETQYTLIDRTLFLDTQERVYRVKDLPDEQKPREKLINYGPEALTVAELLAVILGVGTKKEEILAMASRIVREYGEKSLISQRSPKALARDLDIPEGKATQIIAATEFGRRFFQKKRGGVSVIRTPQDVFDYAHDMVHLPKEHLRGIYLNTHHQVIYDEVISIGTINSSIVHPREVFRPALQYSAVALVLVHNHPSGVLEASEADIDVTKQLVATGKVLGIDLLDHVIVTEKGFISVPGNYVE